MISALGGNVVGKALVTMGLLAGTNYPAPAAELRTRVRALPMTGKVR